VGVRERWGERREREEARESTTLVRASERHLSIHPPHPYSHPSTPTLPHPHPLHHFIMLRRHRPVLPPQRISSHPPTPTLSTPPPTHLFIVIRRRRPVLPPQCVPPEAPLAPRVAVPAPLPGLPVILIIHLHVAHDVPQLGVIRVHLSGGKEERGEGRGERGGEEEEVDEVREGRRKKGGPFCSNAYGGRAGLEAV
jgi:hypothetical protein